MHIFWYVHTYTFIKYMHALDTESYRFSSILVHTVGRVCVGVLVLIMGFTQTCCCSAAVRLVFLLALRVSYKESNVHITYPQITIMQTNEVS